jgi:hypothetical protein
VSRRGAGALADPERRDGQFGSPGQGVALDALDEFLSSDQSPPDSMMLSDLDGF